ncbi:hypothetical protein AYO40_03725 [Planctomycetaceae bacterium SCGC AG-212-D15]|nr:hypothetical protein AYO40_03725 [Planctomycetaceae bacterium SCGC AG-212-D15]
MYRAITKNDVNNKSMWYTAWMIGIALLVWSYWVTLCDLVHRWSTESQYSHGFLVPLFSLFLIWDKRQVLSNRCARIVKNLKFEPLGLAVIGLGIVIRLAGTYLFYPILDAVSLVPCLAGLVLLLGGRDLLRLLAAPLAFLLFMFPLPYQLESALAGPLQRAATLASVYVLQTLSMPALAEGNVIVLNELRIGVVEACNGLSMLVTFFALSAAVALLTRRSWIYKSMALLSAVPLALAVNVLRIVVTAILMQKVSAELARVLFHDLAGWLMMPIAMLCLAAEFWLLQRLLIEDRPTPPPLGVDLGPNPPSESSRSTMCAARA